LLHENGERSDATPKNENEKSTRSAMERDVDAETPEPSRTPVSGATQNKQVSRIPFLALTYREGHPV
jgi:hypothetical protein